MVAQLYTLIERKGIEIYSRTILLFVLYINWIILKAPSGLFWSIRGFYILVLLNMCIAIYLIYLNCSDEHRLSSYRICPSNFDMELFKTRGILWLVVLVVSEYKCFKNVINMCLWLYEVKYGEIFQGWIYWL